MTSNTPLDPATLRSVLGHFCSGVTIITAVDDGDLVGLTCQSFFSLSLDPPLIAFAPSKTSTSYPRIRSAGVFCVNVLAEDQAEICRAFGRSGPDKWSGVDWAPSANGAPKLAGVQAWLDCSLEAEHEGGDHFLTIGRITDLAGSDKPPLLFYKGKFNGLQ
jgi:3-hydroxy-9,10-secoandrosta-1,3,5(10)-triene-9,17-dione monooxygenase reductase component